jgi:septum site-determining protein MinC
MAMAAFVPVLDPTALVMTTDAPSTPAVPPPGSVPSGDVAMGQTETAPLRDIADSMPLTPQAASPEAATGETASVSNGPAGEPPQEMPPANREQQVWFKSDGGKLRLLLPGEGDSSNTTTFSWNDIYQQINQQLNGGDRFWQPNTLVELVAQDRLLDGRQLQAIANTLAEAKLKLTRVTTNRRQTAVAAATAGYSVEQQTGGPTALGQDTTPGQALDNPLYLETMVRSGGDIRHNGSVIILGDLNPGSSVTAAGDILIWGRLRGTVHAGSKGNARAVIMAVQMEPTQIRIADFVARAPENPPAVFQPEVAYVSSQGAIRITRAVDFYKNQAATLRGQR